MVVAVGPDDHARRERPEGARANICDYAREFLEMAFPNRVRRGLADEGALASAFDSTRLLEPAAICLLVGVMSQDPLKSAWVSAVLQGLPRLWSERPDLQSPSAEFVAEIFRQMPRPLPPELRSLIDPPESQSMANGQAAYAPRARILLAAAVGDPSNRELLGQIISSTEKQRVALRRAMATLILVGDFRVTDPSAHAVLFAELSDPETKIGTPVAKALCRHPNALRADIEWRNPAHAWLKRAYLWLQAKVQAAHLPSGFGWHNIVDVDVRSLVQGSERQRVDYLVVTVRNSDGLRYSKCWKKGDATCPKPAKLLGRTFLGAGWDHVTEVDYNF